MSPSKLLSGSFLKSLSFADALSKNQWLLVITGTTLLLTLGIGFVGIHERWQNERRILEDQYTQGEQRVTLLSSLRSKTSNLKDKSEKVLLKGGTADLVRKTSQLAAENDVRIDSVSPQEEAEFGPFVQLQIQVEARSTFLNLLRFLRALESHTPTFKVSRLELSQSPTDSRMRGTVPVMEALNDSFERPAALKISAFTRKGAGR